MKKLVVLMTVLAAMGCEKKRQKIGLPEPKFAYQQEITVQRGFLKGQTGKILSYKNCGDEYDPIVCYTIKLNPALGTQDSSTWDNVEEKDLVF